MTNQFPTTITYLSAIDFRLWTNETFSFDPSDRLGPITRHLEGKNGAGKSSFIEAAIFALTGKDSAGGQAPSHLIRTEASRAVVYLETENWAVERSITRKNNSTLKFSRVIEGQQINPTMTQITQTELRELLGISEQLLIASMIPGFFMKQPSEKRLGILSEVTPQLDRNGLVARMCNKSPQWVVAIVGDLNKKIKIPHYTVVAFKRIEKQKRKSFLEGKYKVCQDLLEKDLFAPTPPEELSSYESLGEAFAAKAHYQEELMSYTRRKGVRDTILAENAKKKKLEEELCCKISECLVKRQPTTVDWGEYSRLEKLLKPYPPRPVMRSVPDYEHCPTCGQAVGSAYKEKVQKDNNANKEIHEEAVEAIKEFNYPLQEKMNELHAENSSKEALNHEITADNKHKDALRSSLERQLSGCEPMPVPEEPMLPQPPQVSHSEEEVRRIKAVCEGYYKAKGAYERDREAQTNARLTMMEVYEDIKVLEVLIRDFENLEVAMRDLPQTEANLKKRFFTLRPANLSVTTENGVEICDENQVPYECMSAGQRMRVDVEICITLQELMAHVERDAISGLASIFVDDFDLADWRGKIEFPEFIREVYFAHVNQEHEKLVVSTYATTSQ